MEWTVTTFLCSLTEETECHQVIAAQGDMKCRHGAERRTEFLGMPSLSMLSYKFTYSLLSHRKVDGPTFI